MGAQWAIKKCQSKIDFEELPFADLNHEFGANCDDLFVTGELFALDADAAVFDHAPGFAIGFKGLDRRQEAQGVHGALFQSKGGGIVGDFAPAVDGSFGLAGGFCGFVAVTCS